MEDAEATLGRASAWLSGGMESFGSQIDSFDAAMTGGMESFDAAMTDAMLDLNPSIPGHRAPFTVHDAL